jgi:hypothetical protein
VDQLLQHIRTGCGDGAYRVLAKGGGAPPLSGSLLGSVRPTGERVLHAAWSNTLQAGAPSIR